MCLLVHLVSLALLSAPIRPTAPANAPVLSTSLTASFVTQPTAYNANPTTSSLATPASFLAPQSNNAQVVIHPHYVPPAVKVTLHQLITNHV